MLVAVFGILSGVMGLCRRDGGELGVEVGADFGLQGGVIGIPGRVGVAKWLYFVIFCATLLKLILPINGLGRIGRKDAMIFSCALAGIKKEAAWLVSNVVVLLSDALLARGRDLHFRDALSSLV